MRDIVSLFESDNVFVLSVNGKAKLLIGDAAVTKQARIILMFAVKCKHKITHSVDAACEIKPPTSRRDSEVTYSGPTYIVIGSGKHYSSTACTHDRDFDHLLNLKNVRQSC